MGTIVRNLVAVVLSAAVMIPGLASVASAGNVRGAQMSVSTVKAHATDRYNVVLAAGEATHISVRGDGDTDIDCVLYDGNGNVVDRDVDSTDTCSLTITPRWTGNFRIEIRNMGSVYNRYVLRTN